MSLKSYWRRRLPILLGIAGLAVSGCVTSQQQQAEKPANTRLERSLLDAAADSELQRDHNAALTYYRTLYRRDPNDAGVVVGLSRNLRRLNRANEANAIVLRAMKNNEKNGELIGELGKIQLALGEPLKAVETLSRAEALTGHQWHLSGALAVAYDRIQMFDQAERAYRKALDLSPENADILNNMALSLALKGELDRAIETLEHATALPEATSQMRQNLALLYAVRGDLEAVERLVRRDLPRQLADENMSQYRRIAKAAATSSRDGETGTAVAEALATPVQVKPEPAQALPAKPVVEVETTPLEPVAKPVPAKAMMADKAKDEPAMPAPAASETAMAAKEGMAETEPAATKKAAAALTKARSDERAIAGKAAEAAAMPEKPSDKDTMPAAPAADSAMDSRMAGARTADEQVERASMAEARPAEVKPAEPEPAATSKPRALTGALADKADAAAPEVAKAEMAKPEAEKDEMAKPAMAKPEAEKPEMAKPAEAEPAVAKTPATAESERMAAGSATADKAMADKAMAEMAKSAEAKAGGVEAMAEKSAADEAKAAPVMAAKTEPAPTDPAADAVAEAGADKTDTMPAKAIQAPVMLASSTPSGYRLQLGSFRSVDRANRLIRMLSDDHGDLLRSTQLGVTEASIDGDRQVFRVMSDTMPDRAAATTLCDALKGRDLGCLMLRNR